MYKLDNYDLIKYSADFDRKIYNNFKELAAKKGKLLNEFLNQKIVNFKYDIKLLKFEEDKNYKTKKVFLMPENHKIVKNAFYIYNLTMRDYIQSVMKCALRRENENV